MYFFPCLEQGGLLYQPLHYHEFGHTLYVLYKQEMDDLIKEIQQVVSDTLLPLSQRNDPHLASRAARRDIIVNRWFDWSQELFCDAVGLQEAADVVEAEWSTVASVILVSEDYHGYFEESMADDIHRLVGDMVLTSGCRGFLREEVSPERDPLPDDTPVVLLNRAWQISRSRPDDYPEWERRTIAKYLRL